MPKPSSVSTFEAIGTHWWVESLDGEKPLTDTDLHQLKEAAETFDALYSRFKPDSLIGQLNATGVIDTPPDELIAMLRFCKEMFKVSHGAFNITVGGALHGLGYGKRNLSAKVDHSPWEHIIVSEARISIPRNMTIDTGGYGKGWLIDVLADKLRRRGYKHFLINGGGDIYVESDDDVELGLEHPYDAQKIIGSTRLKQGALAVSGSAKRTWQHEGREYHHLIDPVTALPIRNQVADTYVLAPTALIADTMATILFLRPDLKDELSERYGLQATVLYVDQLN